MPPPIFCFVYVCFDRPLYAILGVTVVVTEENFSKF